MRVPDQYNQAIMSRLQEAITQKHSAIAGAKKTLSISNLGPTNSYGFASAGAAQCSDCYIANFIVSGVCFFLPCS